MKKLPLKVDLAKDGLAMLFKEYEQIMLQHVWANPQPIGSGALWRTVSDKLPEGKTISRASVIFAANRLVDVEIWNFQDATGKGGHQKRYYPVISEEEMWERLRATISEKV